ncbi:MAG: AgmX/PglI C-terminal domain-containing protein [Myxococcota bacterium]
MRVVVGAICGALAFSALFGADASLPHASAGAPRGHLDAFVVRDKIKRDLPKINRCYESALRSEPELEGKVSVRFAVARAGTVNGVHVVENTTGSPAVERCVARVVGTFRFPSRRKGQSVRFTFPFVFAPQR